MRARFLVGALLSALLMACFTLDRVYGEKLPGLSLVMKSDGLPDKAKALGEDDEPSRYRMVFTEQRMRLKDIRNGHEYLFLLDKNPVEFWKISPNKKLYKDAKHLFRTQEKRDRWERQQLAQLKKMGDAKQTKQFLEENHLRKDRTREIKVEVRENAGTRLDHKVKQVKVYENGRLIVDAYITEDFGITIPFFDFYRHVGAFSEQVLEELKKIEGVPLEADFTVVSGMLNFDIHCEVESVVSGSFSEELFALPPNATEDKARPIAECEICGVEVEKSAPEERYRFLGKDYYFCSKKHKLEWLENLKGR